LCPAWPPPSFTRTFGERQIELVVEHDHVAWRDVKELGGGLHAAPGLVQKVSGRRKMQSVRQAGPGVLTWNFFRQPVTWLACFNQLVEREPTQVVARRRVFRGRGYQAHHQHEL